VTGVVIETGLIVLKMFLLLQLFLDTVIRTFTVPIFYYELSSLSPIITNGVEFGADTEITLPVIAPLEPPTFSGFLFLARRPARWYC